MKNFSNYVDYDKKENWKEGSKLVHGALGSDPMTGSVSFPIFQTATFRFRALGDSLGFDYTRCQNPTIEELERTMAMLEHGTEGFALSSGMAAVMCALSILKPGDHVILSDDIYGGTYEIALTTLADNKIETSFVDLSILEEFKSAIKPNTKMVFIESPTNPMMKVADIAEISKIAKENLIVLEVRLKLKKGDSQSIKDKMNEYANSRREKQPLEYASAGSTFKRGEDFITAKLIDEAGLKGYQIGGAQVSEKHAGFIVNKGDATAKDIFDLIKYVKDTVYDKFGKRIELEVQVLGE